MQYNVTYAVCGYMQTAIMFLRNSTMQYKLFLLSTIVCIANNCAVCFSSITNDWMKCQPGPYVNTLHQDLGQLASAHIY